MIITQPTTDSQQLPSVVARIQGCIDTSLDFAFIDQIPTPAARRYANKVLVHECVTVPQATPMDLTQVEFIATSDPCYKYFEIYKTSDDGGILLNLNIGGLVDSVTINFLSSETCNLPQRMAFRLYGYDSSGKILLSIGNLYVAPCSLEDCNRDLWTGVPW